MTNDKQFSLTQCAMMDAQALGTSAVEQLKAKWRKRSAVKRQNHAKSISRRYARDVERKR